MVSVIGGGDTATLVDICD